MLSPAHRQGVGFEVQLRLQLLVLEDGPPLVAAEAVEEKQIAGVGVCCVGSWGLGGFEQF